MLFEAFKLVAGSVPGSNGIRVGGTTHAYDGLAERATRIASGLIGLGVQRGDPVAILMGHSPEMFAFAQALFAIGAIAVPLDIRAGRSELERAARQCHIRAVLARADLLALATAIAESAGVVLPVIVDGDAGPASLGALERTPVGALPAIGAEDVALYLMSSGSTGRPKVVVRTHGELLADSANSTPTFGYGPHDLLLNLLPAHHAFGFAMTLSHASLSGASTLLWEDKQPLIAARGRLLQAIGAEGVTVLPGVPFLFDLFAGVTDPVDLSRLRLAYSGAIALKRASFDGFYERFGIPIRQVLGTTETLVATFNDSADVQATWDSVGRVAGDTRIEVLPAAESADPAVGELLISSSAVTKGYLDNPEANRDSFRNGGWLSGDLGRIDEDGHVYIVGRKKLIVEVAGQKVDPIEIEDVLMAHPAVAEAVVVGIPDARTGEQRLKAFVVQRSEATAGSVVDFARARLAAHKVPYIVEFRDALPRSATGKVLRGKLVD
ncbi:MAG TPA: class I adenylate-forming enzyme family protein [Devosia sp.]|nr:class I adenylate-forming enzyme family protein [Devosia sp.]